MKKKTLLLSILFFTIVTGLCYYIATRDTTVSNLRPPEFYTSDKGGLAIINEVDEISLKSVHERPLKNITLYDVHKKTYLLKELIGKGSNTLILKFSELQCSYCIEHVLNYIEKHKKREMYNILLIGNFIDRHSFSIFVRMNPQIDMKIYNIGTGTLDLPVDTLDLPYLFVTNKSLRTSDVFVPVKEVPERTDDYLKMIQNKL